MLKIEVIKIQPDPNSRVFNISLEIKCTQDKTALLLLSLAGTPVDQADMLQALHDRLLDGIDLLDDWRRRGDLLIIAGEQ